MTESLSKSPGAKHPGKGAKKGRHFPKGRQVEALALDEVKATIGDGPYPRDMLIEYLHLVQDRYHHLSAAHLAALADLMKLSQAEVYEVATFYAHFDVVKEGEAAPPPLTIRVCDSLTCALHGGNALANDLTARSGSHFRVVRAPCMGRCDTAPVAEVGHFHADNATVETVLEAVQNGQTTPQIPAYLSYEDYVKDGGYSLLESCRAGDTSLDKILSDLDTSGLRGLGGAGFPTGRKWRFVLAKPGPRTLAINGDEGEPGTFKDRYYLERDPHRFLEGMLIAAWAIEAEAAYIYLRDEYPAVREILKHEIAHLEKTGLVKPGYIHLRRGAGAYICGEESAMLESIEGKRGLPRHRPPYVAEVGLFGRPTLINNIETVYWIRDISEKGAKWFAGQGANGRKGLRTFSVSGRVKNPGVKLAHAGITLNELIHDHCGGMADGHRLKGYLPGGASGGILPASKADIPLDFGMLEEYGCFIGSAAVIVFSDQDNIRDIATNIMGFFKDESCGQCTPCRLGTEKALALMSEPVWNESLLGELATVMRDASICGLGQAAPNPVMSVFKHFRDELMGGPK
jgi:NADH:ubiquinone oxidoreductase subunit F (NADH-binding)/NADH:ubiquinone oxidoreductase subunit E